MAEVAEDIRLAMRQKWLIEKWFPRCPDKSEVAVRLSNFYRCNHVYCEMTSAGNKAEHPQARLLDALVVSDRKYAEVGCGGGAMCNLVAQRATVIGFDVSPLALQKAQETCPAKKTRFVCTVAESLPISSNVVDGSYAFEVLEHLWDPVAAVREMVRITKPGGFVLLSMPNRFSMDLHLRKHKLARCLDFLLAGCRYVHDKVTGVAFQNIEPDLEGDVYPDCDMITAVVPANFARTIEAMGCNVDFWDTTYMCAHRDGSSTTLDFQRNAGRPFLRNFGDHVLLLARKY